MNDKTLEALNALAQKLGVSAEYLWRVLVDGQRVTGYVDILFALAFLAGAVACFMAARWGFRGDDDRMMMGVFASIGGFMGSVGLILSVADSIYRFTAPEYMALRALLDLIPLK